MRSHSISFLTPRSSFLIASLESPLPYDKRPKDVLARRISLRGERRLAHEIARDVAQLEFHSLRHPMLEPNAERVFVRGLGLHRHECSAPADVLPRLDLGQAE